MMGSAGCQWTPRHLRTRFSMCMSSIPRRRPGNWSRSYSSATHLGGQALWKLFSDRYSYKSGRHLCLEVAQSCPQCQMGSDYGHRQKTTGAIQSRVHGDTLSVDIVGPLPADHRQEFLSRVCGLLFQIHCPCTCQQPHRKHGERSSPPACGSIFWHPTPSPVRPRS